MVGVHRTRHTLYYHGMLGLFTFIVFSCLVKTGGKFLWGSCETSSASWCIKHGQGFDCFS